MDLDQDFRTVIGKTCHVTSPIRSRIDWLASLKIPVVGLSFAELEMDKTVHLKLIYHCLGGVNVNFDRIFQFTDLETINLIFMDQQSGCEFIWRFS